MFSGTLFAVCAVFFIGAAATANGILAPFVTGEDWATERPLARSTSALTIVVAEYNDETLARLDGVNVTVWRVTFEGKEVAARGPTAADGRIGFELRPGPYHVEIEGSWANNTAGVNLDDSIRLGAYHVPATGLMWRRVPHDVLEQEGDVARLLVRAQDQSLCVYDDPQPSPEANASGKGTARGGYCPAIAGHGAIVRILQEDVVVATGDTTRHDTFDLPVGAYEIEFQLDGRIIVEKVLLLCDAMAMAIYSSQGDSATSFCMEGPGSAVAVSIES